MIVTQPTHSIPAQQSIGRLMRGESQTFTFTEKEITTIQNMMEFYKDFQQELYGYPEPENLFTETQRNLFKQFGVED